MNFDIDVLKLCDEALPLAKKDSFKVFALWRSEYEVPDPYKPHNYFEKGVNIRQHLSAYTGTDFYVLFEYVRRRPVGYLCYRMRHDIEPLLRVDYLLIGTDFSWSMLFSHEDGMLLDGPFYFKKESPPNPVL